MVIKRAFRKTALWVQNLFQGYDPLVRDQTRDFGHERHYPVFIIGAPRTGSTLLYQLLISRFHIAFISNLMALIPRRMVRIAKTARKRMGQINQILESEHGYVPGLHAPNEAGAIMRAWFEAPLSIAEKHWTRSSFALIAEVFDAPLVTKNLFNSLRLERIHGLFPEARYLFVRRDPLFTAQSILLARERVGGSQTHWLGPKPQGYERLLERPPPYQALWQIKTIESQVKAFLAKYNPTNLVIDYQSLCQRSGTVLEETASLFDLRPKPDHPPPALENRDTIRLKDGDWNMLKEAHALLYDHDSQ